MVPRYSSTKFNGPRSRVLRTRRIDLHTSGYSSTKFSNMDITGISTAVYTSMILYQHDLGTVFLRYSAGSGRGDPIVF
jgi:hypothetical protein